MKPECVNGHPLRPGQKFCGKCGGRPKPQPKVEATPQKPWSKPFKDESQVVQDLASVAALSAYRRLNPEKWEEIQMRRTRRYAS